MAQWQNDDGLTVRFGQDQARETQSVPGISFQPLKYLVVDLNWDDLPGFTTDLNNDGTNNGFSDQDNYIPAGSYITRAYIIVETAFAGGTDYDLGFHEKDGTVIDFDGLDIAVITADLAANEVVEMNGALVGTLDSLTLDSYVVVVDTGTFTAGKAKIVIEYIQVAP